MLVLSHINLCSYSLCKLGQVAMVTLCIKQLPLQAEQARLMSNPTVFRVCFDPKEPVSDTW